MKTFEVMEVMSFAKTGVDRLNEDSYAITDYAAAVFDGATDKKGSAPPTPGRRAAQALAEAVSEIGKDCEPEVLVKNLHVAVAPLANGDCEPTAVGALLHIPARKVIRVGDVSVAVNRVFDVPRKRVDETAAEARGRPAQGPPVRRSVGGASVGNGPGPGNDPAAVAGIGPVAEPGRRCLRLRRHRRRRDALLHDRGI